MYVGRSYWEGERKTDLTKDVLDASLRCLPSAHPAHSAFEINLRQPVLTVGTTSAWSMSWPLWPMRFSLLVVVLISPILTPLYALSIRICPIQTPQGFPHTKGKPEPFPCPWAPGSAIGPAGLTSCYSLFPAL